MITLSDKDADFLAAYFREQIVLEHEAYDKALNTRKLAEECKKVLGKAAQPDEKLEKDLDDAWVKVEEKHKYWNDIYEKALVLLMAGSNV